MLGNRVQAVLCTPDEIVSGELRRQSPEGIWVYYNGGGIADYAALKFYPMHRVIEVKDLGAVYR